MNKKLREEVEDLITLMVESRFKELGVTIWGANGDNGIVGTQKKFAEDMKEFSQSMKDMCETIIKMGKDIGEMKKTYTFWSRAIGVAFCTGVITIIVKLAFGI